MNKHTGKLIFGPVPSRRLGRSLGIDILPPKTCNLNCIYCELGPTNAYTTEFVDLVPPKAIEKAFLNYISKECTTFDVVTITASGEPTLHSELGEIIETIKKNIDKPVAVLTNATTLPLIWVREALSKADLVLPSFDAATEKTFRRINRPAKGIELGPIIEGLIKFRKEYRGRLLLEILFVKDVNDSPEEIEALLKYTQQICPDEIQINTVARPPAIGWASPVDPDKLEEIARMFGEKARVITSYMGSKERVSSAPDEDELLEMIKRRPLSLDDFKTLFGPYEKYAMEKLGGLVEKGIIEKRLLNNKEFYLVRAK